MWQINHRNNISNQQQWQLIAYVENISGLINGSSLQYIGLSRKISNGNGNIIGENDSWRHHQQRHAAAYRTSTIES